MRTPQGGNGQTAGGRGGVTLEEMEQLYDAKLTPAQASQSSSWNDYFQVRPPDSDGYLTLGEAKWQWQNARWWQSRKKWGRWGERGDSQNTGAIVYA